MPPSDSQPLPGTTSVPAPARPMQRDVRLTHAQILALRATPQTLVPAPGAGLAIVVERVHLVFDVTTTGYTETADNLDVEYASGANILTVEATGFLDQTTDQLRTQTPAAGVSTPVANSAVRLQNNGDGEFGSGNAANTLSVRVIYRVVPALAFA